MKFISITKRDEVRNLTKGALLKTMVGTKLNCGKEFQVLTKTK
jgi:hypothetical protein